MKKIKVMPPIQVDVSGSEKPLEMDMVKFLAMAMNNHKKFGTGFAGVSQGLKIKTKIDAATDVIELEDVDYAELKSAVNEISFHPVIAMACKLYYDAVEKPITQEG